MEDCFFACLNLAFLSIGLIWRDAEPNVVLVINCLCFGVGGKEGGNKSVWESRELGMRNDKREIYIFMERFRRRRKLEEWVE